MVLIAGAVAERGSLSFTELLLQCRARAEIIVTFMALLELIKLGQVLVMQAEQFGDITLMARTSEGTDRDAPDPTDRRD
jgi:segregation and condensation protein A